MECEKASSWCWCTRDVSLAECLAQVRRRGRCSAGDPALLQLVRGRFCAHPKDDRIVHLRRVRRRERRVSAEDGPGLRRLAVRDAGRRRRVSSGMGERRGVRDGAVAYGAFLRPKTRKKKKHLTLVVVIRVATASAATTATTKSMQHTCLLFPSEGVQSLPPNAIDSTSRGGSAGRDASATISPAGLACDSVLRSGSFKSSLYRSTSPRSRGGENASHLARRGRSSPSEETERGVSRSSRRLQETDKSATASRIMRVAAALRQRRGVDAPRHRDGPPALRLQERAEPEQEGRRAGCLTVQAQEALHFRADLPRVAGNRGPRAAPSAFSSAPH